jgi:hypothetical protein
MQTNNLIRWSGLALLVGGLLYAINGFFHLNNNDPQVTFSPLWLPIQIIITIFYLLDILGLIGLHSYQKDKAGLLGVIGVVLAIIGSALTFIASIGFAFVIPAVTAQQAAPQSPSELISSTGQLAWIGILVLAWIFAFIPGHILIGISTIRAGVLPRWAGVLVVAGMISVFIGAASAPLFWLRNIGGVFSGAGLAWLGFALFSTRKAG